jgi:hypothetical protein
LRPANIERFKQMLYAETDPTKREILSRLLAKQEVELKEADETPTKKPNQLRFSIHRRQCVGSIFTSRCVAASAQPVVERRHGNTSE